MFKVISTPLPPDLWLSPGQVPVKQLMGGSLAEIWLIRNEDGSPFVRKASRLHGENGIKHVECEIAFYTFLKSAPKPLQDLFPELLNFKVTPDYAYFDLSFLPGAIIPSVLETLSNSPQEIPLLIHALETFFCDLFTHGYNDTFTLSSGIQLAPKSLSPKEGVAHFKQLYFDRVLKRLEIMKTDPKFSGQFPLSNGRESNVSDFLSQPTYMINGAFCYNPFDLMHYLLEDTAFLNRMRTPHLAVPIHQDINPGNVMALKDPKTKAYTLKAFDSHGMLTKKTPNGQEVANHQDLIMDLAKVLFGLLGFSDIIQKKSAYSFSSDLGYQSEIPYSRSNLAMAHLFLASLRSEPGYQPYRDLEPELIARVKFACACQFLADMVYRPDSPTQFANDFFQGTLALHDFLTTEAHEAFQAFKFKHPELSALESAPFNPMLRGCSSVSIHDPDKPGSSVLNSKPIQTAY